MKFNYLFRRKWSLLLVSLFLSFSTFAQKTVTGVVSEELGPMFGVAVGIKGTTTAVLTDIDGKFSIKVNPDQTLLFKMLGYTEKEVLVGDQSVINVTLENAAEELSEAIVVGYGTKKKEDNIGSQTSIKADDLSKVAATSFDQAIQGKATGVQITQTSGTPGAGMSIQIRGQHSISSGSSPLYVVDGMIMNDNNALESSDGRAVTQNPMSLINPNDIEGIEILKDAAATAIYGSRGSNGVVIITTKSGKGKDAKAITNIDFSSGITQLTRTAEDIGYCNTTEWLGLVDQALSNSKRSKYDPYSNGLLTAGFKDDWDNAITKGVISREQAEKINTNWFDQILQKGKFMEVNINSSKTFDSGKGQYFMSGNYREDKSVLVNNHFKRYTFRINSSYNPIGTLTVGTNINMSYSKNDRVSAGSGSGASGAGFGQATLYALPWWPIFDASHPSGYWYPMFNLAAKQDRDNMYNVVDQWRVIGRVYGDYAVPMIKGLNLHTEVGYDLVQNNSVYWVNDWIHSDIGFGKEATDRAATRKNMIFNLYANYNRSFGENDKHSFSGTLGTESQTEDQYTRVMSGRNLVGSYKELGSPTSKITMSSTFGNEVKLLSYFARADYKLLGKYLVGLSGRTDGSTRFHPDYRWGSFYSLSGGWLMKKEPWLASIEAVESLKLRGSLGQTGNNKIGENKYVTTILPKTSRRYGADSYISGSTIMDGYGSPMITWEKTNSYDIGLDYGFFKNKLSGSLAYYIQDVTDLLLFYNFPTSAGISGAWGNVGLFRNWGWEFSVNSVNYEKKGFKWTTDFNFSTNSNEIMELTPEMNRSGQGILGSANGVGTSSRVGEKFKTFFMAEYAGVDPEKGIEMIYEIDYDNYLKTGDTRKTGRKVPATIQNINRNRQLLKGKTPLPTFYGGFSNNFSYTHKTAGTFELIMHFYYSGGNYLYDYQEMRTTDVHKGLTVLRTDMIGNTWEKPGDIAKYPELRYDGLYDWGWNTELDNPDYVEGVSDPATKKGTWTEGSAGYPREQMQYSKFLYKGDFIRMKNLQLRYSVPTAWANKIKLGGLSMYIAATNLFTKTTEFKGWDPEAGVSNSGDNVNVPNIKTFTFGLSIKI